MNTSVSIRSAAISGGENHQDTKIAKNTTSCRLRGLGVFAVKRFGSIGFSTLRTTAVASKLNRPLLIPALAIVTQRGRRLAPCVTTGDVDLRAPTAVGPFR